MEITVQWRQDYEQLHVADAETKRVKLAKPIWNNFDISDIMHMPRNHALRLFSNSTPVIARENDTYITNNAAIFDQYKKSKKPVMMFDQIEHSEQLLRHSGLIGP